MSGASTPALSSRKLPRGTLTLLVDPVFGPFFAGRMLSTTGVWIYSIVAAIVAFELTGSALVVGTVSVAQFGPQLVLGPLSGAMADRGDRRLLMMSGMLLVAAASAVLAVWIWLVGGVEGLPGVWPVMAAALTVGIGFVVIGPAQNALIPALVAPAELAQAVALVSVPSTLARASGPAVGAVVASTVGAEFAFAITAATCAVFGAVLYRLDVRGRADGGGGRDLRIRVGVQHLAKDRRLLPLLVGIAALGMASEPVITLTPPLAADFGADSTLVGVFASAFGVGAGVVLLVLTVLRRRVGLARLGPTGLLVLGAGIGSVGVSPTPTLAAVALFFAGCGFTVALISLTTQLQEWLPDHVRGRVMALWMIALVGSRPFAAAANGAVADAASTAMAFLLSASIAVAAAWWCRPVVVARQARRRLSH